MRRRAHRRRRGPNLVLWPRRGIRGGPAVALREGVGEGGGRVGTGARRAVVAGGLPRAGHQARLDPRVPVVDGVPLVWGVAEEDGVRPRVLGPQSARAARPAPAQALAGRVDLELEHQRRQGGRLLAMLYEADLGELEGRESVLRHVLPIALGGDQRGAFSRKGRGGGATLEGQVLPWPCI
jgi:hypothetical protein